ncbi:hypothetical protein GC174_17530 [bacterium]|nr:hypothetical protein [bacterium]
MLNENQRTIGIKADELLESASYASWMGDLIEAISSRDIALLKQWLHKPVFQSEDYFFEESEKWLGAFLDSENSDRDQALANKLLQQSKHERYQSALFEIRQPSLEKTGLVEELNEWIRKSKEQAIKGSKKSYYTFSPKGDQQFPHWNGIFIEQNFNNTLVGWKRISESRFTQPLDSYPYWIYDHGAFDESRDTITLAMAFVQWVLNRNLLSVSPSLSFVSDVDGVIALSDRISVRNPWQAIHLTMFYMVLGKSTLKKCIRPDCITFFTAKRSDARVCKKKACQKWATKYRRIRK